MKKVFVSILLVFAVAMAYSQGLSSWKVNVGNKNILTATAEDEVANIREVKRKSLSGQGYLSILLRESNLPSDWKRTILITDEADKEVLRLKKGSKTLNISLKKIKLLFRDKKQIRIFTTAVPKDPELAARVRVRRVHLCTLELL